MRSKINATYVKLSTGFYITGENRPIDVRFVLSKQEMVSEKFDDGTSNAKINFPDKYFCLCSDDNCLYVYDKENTFISGIGKFRLYASSNDILPLLQQETAERKIEDASLSNKINSVDSRIGSEVFQLKQTIENDRTVSNQKFEQVNEKIDSKISQEALAREQADNKLKSDLVNGNLTVKKADTAVADADGNLIKTTYTQKTVFDSTVSTLNSAIENETLQRSIADNRIKEKLNTVESNLTTTTSNLNNLTGEFELHVAAMEAIIPSDTKEDNKLVNEDKLNYAISTSTGSFIGQFATKQDLDAYPKEGLKNNDYAIVTSDETHSGESWRYKFNVGQDAWKAEAKVSDKPFTPAQQAALDSGITADLVSAYNSHIADTEVHVTSSDKAAWNAKYNKPSTGIPKADLDATVNESLNKADSSLQASDKTELQNKIDAEITRATIEENKLNNRKQDLLIGSGTGQNIKTINNQSLLGQGNLEIDASKIESISIAGQIQPIVDKNVDLPAYPNRLSLGISDVDNTRDINKPISNATQAALDLKASKAYVDEQISKVGKLSYVISKDAASTPNATKFWDRTTGTEVQGTLPPSAEVEFKIYLVPEKDTEHSHIEWMAIKPNQEYVWEKIGSTEIDLSNYYKKAEVDEKISTEKQRAETAETNLSNTKADKTVTDQLTTDVNNLKGRVSGLESTSQDHESRIKELEEGFLPDVYTKSETDALISAGVNEAIDTSKTYTDEYKAQVNPQLIGFREDINQLSSQLSQKQDKLPTYQAKKYLHVNESNQLEWKEADALPSYAEETNKYLYVDDEHKVLWKEVPVHENKIESISLNSATLPIVDKNVNINITRQSVGESLEIDKLKNRGLDEEITSRTSTNYVSTAAVVKYLDDAGIGGTKYRSITDIGDIVIDLVDNNAFIIKATSDITSLTINIPESPKLGFISEVMFDCYDNFPVDKIKIVNKGVGSVYYQQYGLTNPAPEYSQNAFMDLVFNYSGINHTCYVSQVDQII